MRLNARSLTHTLVLSPTQMSNTARGDIFEQSLFVIGIIQLNLRFSLGFRNSEFDLDGLGGSKFKLTNLDSNE